MSIPGSASPLFLSAAAAAAPSAYQIDRSLRFDSSASSYLNRTPSSAGNRKTWTWSGWLKRYSTGIRQIFFSCWTGSTRLQFGYLEDDRFQMGTQFAYILKSNALFRDPAAWQHWVISVDTTLSSNRCKVYLNGSEITSWNTNLFDSTFAQNADTDINQAAVHYIGQLGTGTSYLNAGLGDVHFIDGQALAASDFGEYDDNNVWQPKAYSGTYGTNGFHLDFSDNSSNAALGYDAAGSNDWTVNNLSVASGAGNDSLIDTPTNYEAGSGNNGGNYATLNPLAISPNITPTLSNGNLEIERTAISSQWTSCGSTFAVSSGKYYWELSLPTINGTIARWGVADADDYEFNRNTLATGLPWLGSGTGTSWSMDVGGNTYHNGSTVNSSYTSTVTTSDVIGVALDCDANTLTFYKNGTSLGTAHSNVTASRIVPAVGLHGATHNKIVLNFGQRPFAYTPPTNHLPLVTTSLSDPTIADGSTAFDAKLYTGNGSTQSITGLGFSPDLVWIKNRAAAVNHQLHDIVRGASVGLNSNNTNAEYTDANALTSFDSSGWSMNNNYNSHNQSGVSYVGWAWDGGTSTVSNTDGSITSSVRANASAGFSIVGYTGNGTAGATIGHGLNGPIGFMVIKNRDSAYQWLAWHESFNGNNYIPLNTGDAAQTNSAIWNGTSPSSSVITLGTNVSVNENTSDHIGYVWSPVEGYSAFGSYTGNGSTDGPFVYTGFRPRWVMIKWTTGSNAWIIVDTARDPFNPEKQNLNANDSNAENTSAAGSWFDGLSNGFKITGVTDNVINSSGGTYIYAAFAERPFKTARAR